MAVARAAVVREAARAAAVRAKVVVMVVEREVGGLGVVAPVVETAADRGGLVAEAGNA